MTKKTKKAYLAVFKYIEDKLFKLKPAQFMTDYEDGMRSAIRKYWSSNVTHYSWMLFSFLPSHTQKMS